jgi:hypothetical protein
MKPQPRRKKMLNQTRLINAMKKAGLNVEIIRGGQSYESMRQSGVKDEADLLDSERNSSAYIVVSGDRIVSWHTQGDKAVCVHCTTRNDGRDSMTDYFPGSYARTIKGAVSYLVR